MLRKCVRVSQETLIRSSHGEPSLRDANLAQIADELDRRSQAIAARSDLLWPWAEDLQDAASRIRHQSSLVHLLRQLTPNSSVRDIERIGAQLSYLARTPKQTAKYKSVLHHRIRQQGLYEHLTCNAVLAVLRPIWNDLGSTDHG